MAAHSSTLAWKIPWTGEPGRLQSMALQRVRHDWVTSLSLSLSHLNQREEEEQAKPKVSRRKETIKIRAEISETETKKTIANINETKSWFFEKINKSDKPLARLIKKKRGRIQISKIRIEKGEVTTDFTEIPRIIWDYYEQLYANKTDNLGEMDNFLARHSLPRLKQEETENMNRP